MTEHVHDYQPVSPGRRKCDCGARLAVEVQFHEHARLSSPTLRGSDVEWAQQFRPDRKPSDA